MSENETVTPSTPQTIEGVTVSAADPDGYCLVTFPTDHSKVMQCHYAEQMGLVVPEPVVACRIGNAEFTLTREQVEAVATWRSAQSPVTSALGAAARAHLDSEGER